MAHSQASSPHSPTLPAQGRLPYTHNNYLSLFTFRPHQENYWHHFLQRKHTILNVPNKPSEPILTYACEVRSYTIREITKFDAALIDCQNAHQYNFCFYFNSFNRWESTRELDKSFGNDLISVIFAKRHHNFLSGLCLTILSKQNYEPSRKLRKINDIG